MKYQIFQLISLCPRQRCRESIICFLDIITQTSRVIQAYYAISSIDSTHNMFKRLQFSLELFPSFEEWLREREAREMHRREVADAAIKNLTDTLEKDLKLLEEQDKRKKYDDNVQLICQARSQAITGDPLAGSAQDGVQERANNDGEVSREQAERTFLKNLQEESAERTRWLKGGATSNINLVSY